LIVALTWLGRGPHGTASENRSYDENGEEAASPREEGYYTSIRPGKSLGYVRRDGLAGTWRVREKVDGAYTYKHLR
jgi:hypothetical protein